MSIGRVLAALVFPFCCVAVPGQAAAIVNGSFDTGSLAPWMATGWTITPSVAQSGNDSAFTSGNFLIKQTFSPVPDTMIESLSFWIEHTSTGVHTNAYTLYYSDGSSVQNYVSTSDTVFDLFDVTSRLNPTKSLDGIGIWGTTLGVTYLDTVALTLAAATIVAATPVPEAPSALLLAAPLLLALGVLKRHA